MANEPISPPWDGNVFPTHSGYAYTGSAIIDDIRKDSLKETNEPRGRSQSPRALPPQPVKQPPQPRYPWGDTVSAPALSAPVSSTSSPNHSRNASPASRPYRTDSPTPGRKAKTPPPPVGGRESPGRAAKGENARLGKLERMRLNLNDDKGVPTPTTTPPYTSTNGGQTTAKPSLTPNRQTAQTFAEMGVQGGKAEDKDCVIM
jgi:hypothetical protein